MTARTHGIINDPLVLAKHWPTHSISNSDSEETGITPSSGSASLANFGKSTRDVILSTYQGDFQDIGYRLAEATDNFLDFSILTNVPYGVQSKVKQRQTDTDLHHLYRRFGRFLRLFPNIEYNAFVLAQAHHYGHKLSFEKFSNCGWRKEIAFTNGGIGVHLLRLDMSQLSETKQTIDAYKEIDALPENNAEPTGRGKSVLE